ncbi:MAG: acyl-CoA thioesterase [bacterium]|nr:acyl-CoA thioesterase [bacterium]
MTQQLTEPLGELAVRTTAMPADTNYSGDIFGGWIMSQMDIAGGVSATEITKERIVTIAVDCMRFWHPVNVGDVLCVYSKLNKIGTTSIAFLINAWAVNRFTKKERFLVTEALFTYVVVDKDNRPIPINPVYKKEALSKLK